MGTMDGPKYIDLRGQQIFCVMKHIRLLSEAKYYYHNTTASFWHCNSLNSFMGALFNSIQTKRP